MGARGPRRYRLSMSFIYVAWGRPSSIGWVRTGVDWLYTGPGVLSFDQLQSNLDEYSVS